MVEHASIQRLILPVSRLEVLLQQRVTMAERFIVRDWIVVLDIVVVAMHWLIMLILWMMRHCEKIYHSIA